MPMNSRQNKMSKLIQPKTFQHHLTSIPVQDHQTLVESWRLFGWCFTFGVFVVDEICTFNNIVHWTAYCSVIDCWIYNFQSNCRFYDNKDKSTIKHWYNKWWLWLFHMLSSHTFYYYFFFRKCGDSTGDTWVTTPWGEKNLMLLIFDSVVGQGHSPEKGFSLRTRTVKDGKHVKLRSRSYILFLSVCQQVRHSNALS